MLLTLDGHPAGDGAGGSASPAGAAEGDLRCHDPTPTREDPVLYIHRPGSEAHWGPTDPGTTSVPVTSTKYIFADKQWICVLMGGILVSFSHQVAKLPQIVQQQPTVANIQQIVSSPQQVGFKAEHCSCR